VHNSDHLHDAPVKAVFTSLQLGRRCEGMSPEEVSQYNMDGTLRLVDTLTHAALVRRVPCLHPSAFRGAHRSTNLPAHRNVAREQCSYIPPLRCLKA
jgi:hypothetical protein